MNFRNWFLALFATVLCAQAHPGHDLMAHGPAHVATSAYHLGVLFTVAVVSFAVGQTVKGVVSRRIFRTVGVSALVAGVAVWTLGL